MRHEVSLTFCTPHIHPHYGLRPGDSVTQFTLTNGVSIYHGRMAMRTSTFQWTVHQQFQFSSNSSGSNSNSP